MKKTIQEEKRERYLKNLIKEAILNVLAEQDEQLETAPVEEIPSPQVPPPAPTAAPSTPPASPTAQQPGVEEFTVDTLVDKLNVLRGGKSLKDPEVYGKLTTFFNNLTEEQKTSTKWIMDELTKIVTSTELASSSAPVPPSPEPQPEVPPTSTTPNPLPTPPAPVKPVA